MKNARLPCPVVVRAQLWRRVYGLPDTMMIVALRHPETATRLPWLDRIAISLQ